MKLKINRTRVVVLVLLITTIIAGLAVAKIIPWQKVGDERLQIIKDGDNNAYLYNKTSDTKKIYDQENGKVIDNNTLKQYKITIPNLGSTLDLTIQYELKDGNNKKLLGIAENNIGVKHSINQTGTKLVFNSQSDDIWSIDNNGNLKKISKDSYNGIEKADIYKTEGVYEIWADTPQYIPNTNLIIYRSSLGEDGITDKKAYLWVMDDEGNNNHLVYEGGPSTEIIGFLNNDELLIYELDKIITFNLTEKSNKQILSEVSKPRLSPDKNIIFYKSWNEVGLKFLNFATGAEFEISNIEGGLKYTGFYDWSPDSSKIAFLGGNIEEDRLALVVASIQDKGKILQIIDSPVKSMEFDSSYNPITWLDNNTISAILTDKNDIRKSETWIFDIED